MCLKSLDLYESTSRKCFVSTVNLVTFIAQRPNMAVLSESEVLREFYEIQLSVDGCWEMKMWLDQRLIKICVKLRFWQYTLKLVSSYTYICNFYDTKTIGYLLIWR